MQPADPFPPPVHAVRRPSLPSAPAAPTPHSFPLVAVLAPVLASGLLFALTRSPFALVFAVLGPVVALASLADSALRRRRLARSEGRRFAAEIAESLADIDEGHARERAEADAAHPGIRALLARQDDDGLWDAEPGAPVLVTLGRGTVASGLEVDGNRHRAGERDPATRVQLERVLHVASLLVDAPVVLDARLGIGLCGPRAAAQAAARACALQVARAVSPAVWTVRLDESSAWALALPHRRDAPEGPESRSPPEGRARRAPRRPVARVDFVLREEGATAKNPDGRITVAVADRAADLPRDCRVLVHVGSGTSATYSRRGSHGTAAEVCLDYAAAHEAASYARSLRTRAELEGLIVGGSLPDEVRLASLAPLDAPPRPTSAPGHEPGSTPTPPVAPLTARRAASPADTLSCAVGRSGEGVWHVDLVAEGPHAVIGGTTGSGKSELLISWVLAMAAAYPPARVTFLLVDFKGGASFNAIASLPHSVGVITDLDPAAANRALESLRAEVLFRERALVRADARSIEHRPDLHELARLVIVVDEFAALGSEFPGLHQLFADLASRGRSLGIHLILCTQRPADALRDAILANCTLRVSLRLNSRADSLAVIGTGAAAELPRHPRGRALAAVVGEEPRVVQVALSDSSDPARVLARWPAAPQARRPWCDPLPRMLPFGELPFGELEVGELPFGALPAVAPGATSPGELPAGARGSPAQRPGGLPFGLLDLPREQRHALAVYRPREHGNVLVCGGQGSGKSTAIRAIGASAPPRALSLLPDDVEGAWDDLSRIAASIGPGAAHGGEPRLLLVDDLDSIVARYAPEHQLAFIDLMAAVLRDGPRHGTTAVLTVQRVPSALHGLAVLCGTRLLLRLPSRQDHLLLGGRGEQYDERMPPGGGVWHGERVQVGFLAEGPASAAAPPPALAVPPGGFTAVVTAVPGEFAARLPPGTVRIVHPAAVDASEIARTGEDRARGPHTLIVGDASEWQGAWALLARVRGTIPLLFDSCAVGDVRAVTGSRVLPPPLAAGSRSLLVLTPADRFVRASLPGRTAGGVSMESAQNTLDSR